ncbi:FMN-linked oxidoreductase [Basidiobolus meristosporus CBS 931.73]|uniref:tRNA-dihydrouridine(47) synthase [NAD(P)(+)] n=1 Tax=Basidiobolus meristosporus CBS 931.73 TaxID=1314790 RepID=A0A1Y1XRV5_9FUNG|nr:FMN-linked oxidoreductase [Basidiobolus meristosporus CBS 931.73]|eukprot:ORX88395.1 FMN-linked oxidoreductase [Basidiobolus meristosporus CBS 931.73]
MEQDKNTDITPTVSETSTPKPEDMAAEPLPSPLSEPPKQREKGIAPIKPEYLVSNKPQESSQKVTEERVSEPPKKRMRGQNKGRESRVRTDDEVQLCNFINKNQECPHGESCKYTHDVKAYMEAKGNDIGDKCPHFENYGSCPYGYKCRFAKHHVTDDLKLIVKPDYDGSSYNDEVKNTISRETQKKLRLRQYEFPKSTIYLKELEEQKPKDNEPVAEKSEEASTDGQAKSEQVDPEEFRDTPDVPLRGVEKKKVDFRGKTYLAPLTTVGNLPFRRICKEFGVDITCGEMAMTSNLLQGQQTEWSHMKRHKSEDIFGVQICGNKPETLVKTAEVINNELDVDFVDVNCGCPIDIVFKRGGGSGLLTNANKLGKCLRGMNRVLDCPLTIKFRMAIVDKDPIGHKLAPKFQEWGCALGTLHGRSRQQRYTKLADWDYIEKCAGLLDEMPLFGNGDVLSWEEYHQNVSRKGVAGIMIGRGALIKPWIFDEIQTKRHWDISANERFDIMKKFCNYGLEHWGSDTLGVNTTRKFFLEWQSFLYRYIPVGLLEVLPQKINERPPPFVGRNDLETLMASPNVSDWVKLSEMILGPAPDNFNFLPKHKSNSYEG